jgi:nicotinate-nucleotide adenylyltransferase
VAIFGGTFDPPHIGHLVAAVNVRQQLDLDVVTLMVANEPWQKVGSHQVVPASLRLAMVAAAVDGVPGLEASGMEIDRGGLTYTVDTLHQLVATNPDAELHVVIGADAAAGLSTWKRVDEVRALARLVVVTRPGVALGPDTAALDALRADANVDWVEIPRLDVASHDIRSRVADGRPIDFLVPASVASVITDHALYGGAFV